MQNFARGQTLRQIVLVFFTLQFMCSGAEARRKEKRQYKPSEWPSMESQESQETNSVFGPKRLRAKKKRNAFYKIRFATDSPEQAYVLKIQNGKEAAKKDCDLKRGFSKIKCHFHNFKKYIQAKKTRVIYGKVELNGETVVSAAQLNIATGRLEVPVNLQGSNNLKVSLFGHSRAYVILTIQATGAPVNQAPNAVIAAESQSGFAPLEVAFDGSGSTDDQDSSQDLQYEWDFGDGSELSNEISPTKIYEVAGVYTAVLQVTDSEGLSASESVEIEVIQNNPPLVAITATPTEGRSPLSVDFDSQGTSDDNTANENLTFAWDFGDGSEIASGSQVNHIYETAGDFEAILTVTDEQGLSSSDSIVILVEENQAPVAIASVAPSSGSAPLEVSFDASSSSDPNGDSIDYFWNFGDGNVGSGVSVAHIYQTQGLFTATLTVTDSFGLSSQDNVVIDVQAIPFGADNITIASPTEGEQVNQSPIVIAGSSDTALSSMSVNGQSLSLAADGLSFTGSVEVAISGALALTFEAEAITGERAEKVVGVSVVLPGDEEPDLPPDPATVAPTLVNNTFTPTSEATEFLYTGADPIQVEADPNTFNPILAGVIRGQIRNAATTDVLSGVKVEIKGRAEYGYTYSRSDGVWDLAVNAGPDYVVEFSKPGFLSAQRTVSSKILDFRQMDPVALVPLSSKASLVELNDANSKVVQGVTVASQYIDRTPVLMFRPGTNAQFKKPDGSLINTDELTLRTTEYTAGPLGLEAMPANLPPTTAFMYAVEFSADEAIEMGAESILFSQPVVFYQENFLGAPQGTGLPVGVLNRATGYWEPRPNGRVIEVLSEQNGVAEISVNIDGLPATQTELDELGIDQDELQNLSSLYDAGTSLWRVELESFSAYDINHPYAPPSTNLAGSPSSGGAVPTPSAPAGAGSGFGGDGGGNTDGPTCSRAGSIIKVQDQSLGEEIDIVGAPFSLRYHSDRVPGRKSSNKIVVPLVPEDYIPADLCGVGLKIEVAGRTHLFSFREQELPPNLKVEFEWDGKDAYGREVNQSVEATVTLTTRNFAKYVPVFADRQRTFADIIDQDPGIRFAPVFSNLGCSSPYGEPNIVNGAFADLDREFIDVVREYNVSLGGAKLNQTAGLGGWMPDIHHEYSPSLRTVFKGDGTKINANDVGRRASIFAGGNQQTDDDIPAFDNVVAGVGVATDDDGNVYYTSRDSTGALRFTKKAGRDGIARTVAVLDDPNSFAGGQMEVGPDGTIYCVVDANNFVMAIDQETGESRIVAGTGQFGFSGDGGPATQANLGGPRDVAVSSDGRLYILESTGRIRVVGVDGRISTYVGTGESPSGNIPQQGILAKDTAINGNGGLAVGPDDELYFTGLAGNTIGKVNNGGVVEPIFYRDSNEQELPLEAGSLIDVDKEGNIYIVGSGRVDRWNPTTEKRSLFYGRPVSQAPFRLVTFRFFDGIDATQIEDGQSINGLSVAPNGDAFVVTNLQSLPFRKIVRVGPAFGGYTGSEITIVSPNGDLIYTFDRTGKHISTSNAKTGAVVYLFSYDGDGLLSVIEDGDGNITQINRSLAGIEILPPFAGATQLNLNADGYLANLVTPQGRQYQMGYMNDGLGLLTSFQMPNTAVSTFEYESDGRLKLDTNAVGGFFDLEQILIDIGVPQPIDRMTLMTGEGRESTFETTVVGSDVVHTNTDPAGFSSESILQGTGGQLVNLANQERVFYGYGTDPRFGRQATFISEVAQTQPSGKTLVTETTRTFEKPGGQILPTTVTDATSVNGKIYTDHFDRTSLTNSVTTPEGRATTIIVDGQERPESIEIANVLPIEFVRDLQGRLTEINQGARKTTFAYDGRGFLSSLTDAENRTTTFISNDDGEVIEQVLPGNRHLFFERDGNGNITSVTTPTNNEHFTLPNLIDLLTDFIAPEAITGAGEDRTTFAYNLDKQLTQISRPDGKNIVFNYDEFGRLETQNTPRGDVAFTYSANDGQLESVTSTDSITTTLSYDGSLLTQSNWSGPVSGSLTRVYNDDFLITERSVNGGNAIGFGFDLDDNITSAGSMTLTYDPDNGFLTSTTLGTLTETISYNQFGEVSQASTAGRFTESFTRDNLGRIKTETETIGGITTNYEYFYDELGQLDQVFKNGSLFADYNFDDNGNRTSATINGTTSTGSYDNQDRLTSYGSLTFTYNRNGDLATKIDSGVVGTTLYDYDVFGNLKQVTLADGKLVEYLVDGFNRRVGKRVNGVLTKGFLYKDQLNPIVELDGSGNVVSRFVYASKSNVPDYMIKGGVTYKIISDHLGSVRLVVNASSGAIAQRIDYDEWGVVTQDTSPGFQPFGFAGGIYDSDTGLVRFGARDYDAHIGRWTAKDGSLFDSGLNLYAYALNDPANYVDTEGFSRSSRRRANFGSNPYRRPGRDKFNRPCFGCNSRNETGRQRRFNRREQGRNDKQVRDSRQQLNEFLDNLQDLQNGQPPADKTLRDFGDCPSGPNCPLSPPAQKPPYKAPELNTCPVY